MKVGELFLGLELQRTSFDASLAAVKGEWGQFGKTLASGALVAGGVALAGLAAGLVESAHKAADFQQQMEMIRTQAGASQAEVDAMSKSVLDLAGEVSTAPQVLAAAMYHIESTGFRGAKALDALRIAAEGAKVGNANLVDVTNALDAVLVAGVPEAKNMAGAMGELNAIVGAGDMTMQDLADAMGTGVLAKAKTFGLGLQDVGAALAVLGDNNIRGSDAATKLGMSFALLSAQKAPAIKALSEIGIKTDQLGNDMRKGGLVLALQDLQDHLTKSGKTAQQQGDILSAAFGGGKSAGTIELLLQQLPRLKDKFGDVGKGAAGFGDAWAATQQNVNTKLDGLKAAAEAAGIKVGTVLLPYVGQLLDKVTPLVSKFGDWASSMLTKLGPALGDLSKHFQAGEFSEGIAAFIYDMVGGKGTALTQWVEDVVPKIQALVGVVVQWGKEMWAKVAPALQDIAKRSGDWKPILEAIGIVLGFLVLVIGNLIVWIIQLADWMLKLYDEHLVPMRDAFIDFANNVLVATARGIGGLVGAIQSVMDWFQRLGTLVTAVGHLIGDFGSGKWASLAGDAAVVVAAFNAMGSTAAAGTTGRMALGSHAMGGPVAANEWSWVGETGPELVRFPSAGRVYSASQSAAMAKGGQSVVVHVYGSVQSERELVEAVRQGIRRSDRAVR